MKNLISDETIEQIIRDLDFYARDYDSYEYGLPDSDEHLDAMKNIIKNIVKEEPCVHPFNDVTRDPIEETAICNICGEHLA